MSGKGMSIRLTNEKRKGIIRAMGLFLKFGNKCVINVFDVFEVMATPSSAICSLVKSAIALAPEDAKSYKGRVRETFDSYGEEEIRR